MLAPSNLWRSWSVEPGVLALLAISAIGYLRGTRVSRRYLTRIVAFAVGWLVLAIALVSPLDGLAETLFAAHMAQHLALMVIAAPLLVIGVPPATALWALPHRQRLVLARWWSSSPRTRRAVEWPSNPMFVVAAQTFALWFWHFPRPYRAALEHPALHALEHASFLGTAVLFWWVVLHPTGRRTLGFGAAILCVGVTLCQSGALGALLMFSTRAWYPIHAAGERLWGISPLDDQRLAGLIMWIPAGAVYVAAASVLFIKWMRADERAMRVAERQGSSAYASVSSSRPESELGAFVGALAIVPHDREHHPHTDDRR